LNSCGNTDGHTRSLHLSFYALCVYMSRKKKKKKNQLTSLKLQQNSSLARLTSKYSPLLWAVSWSLCSSHGHP